jgi:hypothetical protein
VHLIAVPKEEEGLKLAIGETHRRYSRRINFRMGIASSAHRPQQRPPTLLIDCPMASTSRPLTRPSLSLREKARTLPHNFFIDNAPPRPSPCPLSADKGHPRGVLMKSQDIFILLKLTSLQSQEKAFVEKETPPKMYTQGWEGWDMDPEEVKARQATRQLASLAQASLYTVRGLAEELGIGKTEVNNAINRCIAVGMINLDRHTNRPKANLKVLREFIIYGLKYVFPVKPAEIVRGIPTSFAAPVLEGQLMTAGEMIYVWPDARGKSKGQLVAPLFKSVPYAVKRDPRLYEYLALVDAIRLGSPREANLAEQLLQERLK